MCRECMFAITHSSRVCLIPDMNWKVRRASAKTLAAVIVTRSELLEELYKEVAHKLVSRFKEREETVKLEVFQTFSQLLTRTRAANNPKYVPVSQPQLPPQLRFRV